LGLDEDSWQLAGGGQMDVGNGWSLGDALSHERSDRTADDSNAGSNGARFQAGVSARRRFDATELSGALAVGYDEYDIDRSPWPGVRIDATRKRWLYSGRLRAARLFESGRWSFKPSLDPGVDHLSMDGFNESGASDFRIRIDGENDTYVHLRPAIDIQTGFETEAGTQVRPRLSLGITRFLGSAAPSLSGRFAIASADVAPSTASTDLDRTRFEVAAGVDVFARNDLTVRAEVFGSFSNHSESHGGGVRVPMAF
jgi:uncharacterized protein with beta-barrel porin domain